MKDVELKLISELMKNSKRSDRELAKVLGVSQPTATRVRGRLEKEGYIREYTIIPDFSRIGYEICSVTFARMKEAVSKERVDETKELAKKMERGILPESVLITKGLGCEADMIVVSFHANYESYTRFVDLLKTFPNLDPTALKSFMISLPQDHYRNLTFATLSKHMLTLDEKK